VRFERFSNPAVKELRETTGFIGTVKTPLESGAMTFERDASMVA